MPKPKDLPKFGVLSPDGAGGYQVTNLGTDKKRAEADAAALPLAYWVSISAHEVKKPKPPKGLSEREQP